MSFAQAAIVNCQSNTGVLADVEYFSKRSIVIQQHQCNEAERQKRLDEQHWHKGVIVISQWRGEGNGNKQRM